MAKKKLLNEATVRRFMGLAGMQSNIVSNKLNEMYGKPMEEEEDEEEGPEGIEPEGEEEPRPAEPMDAEPMDAEPMDAEPMDAEPMDDDVRELSADDVETLEMLADKLPDIVAKLQGDEPMDDEPMGDEPMDDEPAIMEEEEVLEGVELELSEDEIVQEVAKRVAKRILKAKRAQRQLDEALGRKTKK
jgi:hypothetical protein